MCWTKLLCVAGLLIFGLSACGGDCESEVDEVAIDCCGSEDCLGEHRPRAMDLCRQAADVCGGESDVTCVGDVIQGTLGTSCAAKCGCN
jgi:hypothetical protein